MKCEGVEQAMAQKDRHPDLLQKKIRWSLDLLIEAAQFSALDWLGLARCFAMIGPVRFVPCVECRVMSKVFPCG